MCKFVYIIIAKVDQDFGSRFYAFFYRVPLSRIIIFGRAFRYCSRIRAFISLHRNAVRYFRQPRRYVRIKMSSNRKRRRRAVPLDAQWLAGRAEPSKEFYQRRKFVHQTSRPSHRQRRVQMRSGKFTQRREINFESGYRPYLL